MKLLIQIILSIITAKFNIGAPEEIRTPDHLVRSQVLYPAELRAQIDLIGAPEEIRTPDPLVRSQVLYPAELRARQRYYIPKLVVLTSCLRRGVPK